jgi:SAM-dependent methyltransferase
MKIVNWQPAEDRSIRPGAVALQSALHERKYTAQFKTPAAARAWLNTGRTSWRHNVLKKIPLITGRPIGGKILEIGAGTAWASALLSKLPGVLEVDVLEYDPYCVEVLIPQVFQALAGSAHLATRILGSFNRIQKNQYYDYIISIGALHHSEDLGLTLRESFGALQPGGWLIATEPCYENTTTNAQIQAMGEKIDPNSKAKYGKQTQHQDNSDHYYRLNEYEVAAAQTGFDVWAFTFDVGGEHASDRSLQSRLTYRSWQKIVLQPYFASNPKQPEYDRLLLACQKPE